MLQHCNRPNIFTRTESPKQGPETHTLSSKLKELKKQHNTSEFSNARISVKLAHGDGASHPLSLAIEEESEHSENKQHAHGEYKTLMDPITTHDNLDLRKICQRANRDFSRPSTAANNFRKPKIGVKKLSIDPNARRVESARH